MSAICGRSNSLKCSPPQSGNSSAPKPDEIDETGRFNSNAIALMTELKPS